MSRLSHPEQVIGIDAVLEFIGGAKTRFPGVHFLQQDYLANPLKAASTQGILAWYSLIHCVPRVRSSIYEQLYSALEPGGSLLLGYFVGNDGVMFDHAITPAYFGGQTEIRESLETLGFTVVE